MLIVFAALVVIATILVLLDKRAERQRRRESAFLRKQRAIDSYFKAFEEW